MSDSKTARFYRKLADKARRDLLGSVPVDVSTIPIPMPDGHENEARIFKRQSDSICGKPLVVLVYGGGFITGDNNSATPFALPIANACDAVVVSISYRSTPEFKFPTQGNDVWDTVQWLAANATSLGADPSVGFILGGESAGGNVAAVAAVKAVHTSMSPPLTGLWLSVPWLLDAKTTPRGYENVCLSREQNANTPLSTNDLIKMVEKMWCPDYSSPEFSPFNSLELVDSKHPSTYIQVCGMDPMRDDGLIYESLLSERGVKTKVDVYPGVPHAHWAMLPNLKSSQKSMVDAVIGVGWLLGKTAPMKEIKEALGGLASGV